MKKFFTLILALALTMGLAIPASAAGDTAQRGVLTYSESIAPKYDDALSFSEGLGQSVKQVQHNDQKKLQREISIRGIFWGDD